MMVFPAFVFLTWTAIFGFCAGFSVTTKTVDCGTNSIGITIEFEDEFNGVVFSKNYFSNQDCKVLGDGSKSVKLIFPLITDSTDESFCGITVEGALNYAVEIVVSGLQTILIAGIQEYEVQCTYSQADVTITYAPKFGTLKVVLPDRDDASIITGASSTDELPTQLNLHIIEGHGYSGNKLQQAYVGQEITLDVSFEDGGDEYDMFIHNCVAHDGKGDGGVNITLINEKGCGIAVDQITNPPIQEDIDDSNMKHVFLPLYGFRFTTSEFVFFECQVRPCFSDCETVSVRFTASACDGTATLSNARFGNLVMHDKQGSNFSNDAATNACNGTVGRCSASVVVNGKVIHIIHSEESQNLLLNKTETTRTFAEAGNSMTSSISDITAANSTEESVPSSTSSRATSATASLWGLSDSSSQATDMVDDNATFALASIKVDAVTEVYNMVVNASKEATDLGEDYKISENSSIGAAAILTAVGTTKIVPGAPDQQTVAPMVKTNLGEDFKISENSSIGAAATPTAVEPTKIVQGAPDQQTVAPMVKTTPKKKVADEEKIDITFSVLTTIAPPVVRASRISGTTGNEISFSKTEAFILIPIFSLLAISLILLAVACRCAK